MAVPTIRAVSEIESAGSESSFAVPKPSGTIDGDFLIAAIYQEDNDPPGSTGVNPPDGSNWNLWGSVENPSRGGWMSIWVKLAASEPTTWLFTAESGGQWNGGVYAIQIATFNANPLGPKAGQLTSSGTSHATPSITTPRPKSDTPSVESRTSISGVSQLPATAKTLGQACCARRTNAAASEES